MDEKKVSIENSDNERDGQFARKFWHRYRISPRTDEELETLAGELLEWARHPETYVFMEVVEVFAISRGMLYEWAKRCEKLKLAMDSARAIIGARRERKALENKLNAAIVMRTMGLYDSDFKEYEKEMRSIGSEDKGSPTINVVMPQMPTTEAVPKKRGRKKEATNQGDHD